ncbi:MAG: glucokinase [Enterobacterales bacterium]|jgi:glucokinase
MTPVSLRHNKCSYKPEYWKQSMRINSKSCPYIVADIGGTNTRFGLVTEIDAVQKTVVIENQLTYESASLSSIEEAILRYKESLGELKVNNACIAIAGPVVGDRVTVTNLDWKFSIAEVKEKLCFDNLMIINDFAAYAYAIHYLDKSCFRSIRAGIAVENFPVAVLGPGTGFGSAMLINDGNKINVLALEGGHISLAANNALQAAIKEYMSRRFDFVSIERVFSGPGLRYLYQALAAVEGTQPTKLRTSEISQAALNDSDELCVRTLSLFCSWLGSTTGDFALTLGAQGGIYLGGGVLPRIADFLMTSDFESSFKAKGQMQHYLENIPIQLITKGNSALLGSAAWFEDNIN